MAVIDSVIKAHIIKIFVVWYVFAVCRQLSFDLHHLHDANKSCRYLYNMLFVDSADCRSCLAAAAVVIVVCVAILNFETGCKNGLKCE